MKHLLLTFTFLFAILFFSNAQEAQNLLFPPLQAEIKNGQLTVGWETPSETDVSHYYIEASKEGKQFTKIGDPILSKAENGTSATKLEYTFTTPLSTLTATLSLLLLPFLTFSFIKRNKKYLFFIPFICIAIVIGCIKPGQEITKDDKVHLRVAQVDKQNITRYSKIVGILKK